MADLNKKIITIDVTIGNYNNIKNKILLLGENRQSSYICISNVHMVIEAYLDKKFEDVVNGAAIATPDGMPLAKAIKWLYGIDQDRIAGMDLMPDLMKECESKNLSIYLYGSTNDVLEKIILKAKQEFPNLKMDF